ncbi:MAG TPA: type II toxin-antitoxin system RelE/ParE family toxin [Blastocatellia bacterium]|nr:type II toxin-antitoxin system RelE/ParE family toxin [Blastocatellia bacterium]
MRTIVFYRTESGGSPIQSFLDPLPAKHAQRVAWVLRLIEHIDVVPAQYFKKLPGTRDLWEVRVQSGGNAIRLLWTTRSPFLCLPAATSGDAPTTGRCRSIAIGRGIPEG